MSIIIGIDVGGSTTKIVGLQNHTVMNTLLVKASDPAASIYGAFGKFTSENDIELRDIEKVMLTGVGSTFISDSIYGLKTQRLSEFDAIGRGGLYMSGLCRAVVVSMGTGTALVYADKNENIHLGGTGVGGGTIIGLAKRMLSMQDVNLIAELALEGNLSNVNLLVDDISNNNLGPTLESSLTAANFGKLSDIASKADIALGIINLVFETIAMMAVFAARQRDISDVVLVGNLSVLPQCRPMFTELERMLSMRFVIPESATFATAIGAALT